MNLRRRLRKFLLTAEARLRPARQPADLSGVVNALSDRLIDQQSLIDLQRRDYMERCHELIEARAMQGTGPWLPGGGTKDIGALVGLRESNPVSAQGSMGDLELALQNVEWRREVQLSWLEFSRWGIQQIILISRLYYTKNPIIRRLINVDAYYVFGRGVEISSEDESANDAIKEFLELNKKELGQNALSEHQKRANYDGNLFFVFFPDTQDSGSVPVRTLDATEVQDIITNPEDTCEEWYFKRTWTERVFNPASGTTSTQTKEAWYPAVGYSPTGADRLETINGNPVQWDTPVLHRKYGAVGKWLFGCPVIYPALDWAKASRRYLEACGTLAASLAQFALMITTKGGQQALEGIKQQLSTTVGPNTSIWDQNPTAVNASTFASGPGTTLEAFQSRGQGLDPGEVKQFVAMCAICMDIPPTFLGDLETANLATATSLDRPTELAFMHKQEAWRELLTEIVIYALNAQLRAPGGKLREAISKTVNPAAVRITEAPRIAVKDALPGKPVSRYMTEAERKAAKLTKKPTDIEITVTFPSIREADTAALITAVTEAMTLGNRGGQIVGIDAKEGVRKLFELAGIENADEIVEAMYPSTGPDKYDPNRTKMDAAALQPPISARAPFSKGGPQMPGGKQQQPPEEEEKTPGQEALTRLGWTAQRLRKIVERKNAA